MVAKQLFYFVLATALCLALGTQPVSAESPLSVASISKIFTQAADSSSLADPAMILIDKKTSEIVFEKNASSLRKPASILKILSSAVALEYLGPSHQFETRAYLGTTPRTFVLKGEFDPWMTSISATAQKYHRAFIPYLGSKAMEAIDATQGFAVKSVVVLYSGIYSGDVRALGKYLRAKGVTAKFSEITPSQQGQEVGSEIAVVHSPTVAEMTKFALTWSDNLLAERLARAGAHAAGFTMADLGVADAMKKLLVRMEINSTTLSIQDGSGLSKLDRVSALMMAQLLMKIRHDERFAAIYAGLPISGLTGTLEDRYFKTAPQAIGLVHAKTGTLDGTVSLAGYVDAGDREYIFVGIADQIHKGNLATTQARNTLDRLMGKIAAPLFVGR